MAGLPGTGKGTTVAHLKEVHGAYVVGVGDLLRRCVTEDTFPALTSRIREGMAKYMVDVDVVWEVLMKELSAVATGASGDRLVVLDGIPRTVADATNALSKLVPLFDEAHVLLLETNDDGLLVARCLSRGRADSCTPEAVLERIGVERSAFEDMLSVPGIKEHLVRIDATGTVADVCSQVEAALGLDACAPTPLDSPPV